MSVEFQSQSCGLSSLALVTVETKPDTRSTVWKITDFFDLINISREESNGRKERPVNTR